MTSSSSSSSLPLPSSSLPVHHVPPLKNPLAVLLHRRQQNNPVVKYIKNVPHEVSDEITPDFIVGPSACVVYVELTYHLVRTYLFVVFAFAFLLFPLPSLPFLSFPFLSFPFTSRHFTSLHFLDVLLHSSAPLYVCKETNW